MGLLGSTLAMSGLVAYGIIQVPTLRVHLGDYNDIDPVETMEEIVYNYNHNSNSNNSSNSSSAADTRGTIGMSLSDIAYGSVSHSLVTHCSIFAIVADQR